MFSTFGNVQAYCWKRCVCLRAYKHKHITPMGPSFSNMDSFLFKVFRAGHHPTQNPNFIFQRFCFRVFVWNRYYKTLKRVCITLWFMWTLSYAYTAEASGKRRMCSLWPHFSVTHIFKLFSVTFSIFLPTCFLSHLLQTCCIWQRFNTDFSNAVSSHTQILLCGRLSVHILRAFCTN